MATSPTIMTDPARELAEMCQSLYGADSYEAGEAYLAQRFGVEAWSRDFYQIIFAILDRIGLVESLIMELDLDADLKSEALNHASALKGAFTSGSLGTAWRNHGEKFVSPINVQPIKMLASMVRQRVSYPKLSDNDIEEIQFLVEELIGWLNEHQLVEADFIRQALIEGLSQFSFRLSRLEWLGHGYTVASLREVISAYMALERSVDDPAARPDAEAMMKKTGSLIRSVYEKMTVAKGVVETGDFMLKAYGAASLAMSAFPKLAGLLPSAN